MCRLYRFFVLIYLGVHPNPSATVSKSWVLLPVRPLNSFLITTVCCSVLQCVAVCCSVLQCVAVCCSVLQCGAVCCSVLQRVQCVAACAVCCSVLQCVAALKVCEHLQVRDCGDVLGAELINMCVFVHTTTYCNTLQHTATHCHILQHTATHCNTLQRTATHCNTLRRIATRCNALRTIICVFSLVYFLYNYRCRWYFMHS